MQFVDQVVITVQAGYGGDGIVTFRHEKFVPRGGPSGGNGGRGGSVIIRADGSLNTLVDLRYKRKYEAKKGGNGGSNDKHGKDGEDIIIRVPVGTVVTDIASGNVIADLASDGQEFAAAKGGAGGRGNASFATSTLQTPKFAEKGEPTEPRELSLELKLLADVGLVGYPNVGKSTLISRISAAKPRIADYPFTTLVPNLGVVRAGDTSFVVADMPGLIDGAHDGAGLGLLFLRHIERTRLLVHLIDVSGMTDQPFVSAEEAGANWLTESEKRLDAINAELAAHSDKLAAKPQIVALNKIDVAAYRDEVDRLRDKLVARGLEVFEISAVTGEGVQPLVYRIAHLLEDLPRESVVTDEVVRFTVRPEVDSWHVDKTGDGEYAVIGREIEVLVARTDINNEYALRRMHRQLDKMGVIKELRDAGAVHGDIVRIREWEFEFSDEA